MKINCFLVGGVAALAVASPAQASFPGANGRIVFTSLAEGPRYQLFDMNADGRRLRSLAGDANQEFQATYSPDGRRIAFARMPVGADPEDQAELWLMDDDGSHQRRVTFNRQPDYAPAWSPDGQKLVFARRPPRIAPGADLGPADLWILELRSGAERPLTSTPAAEEGHPQWSPDGDRIAFESDISGDFEIYTIRPDGHDGRRLTRNPDFDLVPSYSPDGRRITYSSQRDGNLDVYVTAADGVGREQRLTFAPVEDLLSSFSPDGRFIVYQSEQDGDTLPDDPGYRFVDIFRMRADGSEKTNLTRSPSVDDFDADWQPLR